MGEICPYKGIFPLSCIAAVIFSLPHMPPPVLLTKVMFTSTWLFLCPYTSSSQPDSVPSASSLTSGGNPSSWFLAHFWTGLGCSWELSPLQGGSWHQDIFWSVKSCLKQYSLYRNSAQQAYSSLLLSGLFDSWFCFTTSKITFGLT